jgi:putative peptidoglycan lipid II flippase
MSQMLKSSGAMAAATLASRALGLLRDMAYTSFMGVGAVAGAFTLAFQVPNLFRRLLGEGALTAAFIPIFKRKEITEGHAEMWRVANAVISGLVATAAGVTVVGIAGISIVLALDHGWKSETVLMLQLLRIMFPYMLLVCLTAVLIGMANARGHFFVPAMGAAVLNVVMIASVFLLAPRMGPMLEQKVFALAIGVVVAGIAQVLFQMPSLFSDGYRYQWVSPWKDPTVREVAIKMLPGSIGVAAFQINVLLISGFSFWFDPSIVASFNYAVRLMEFPQGLFGISLATYLLPALSGLAAEKKYPEFRQTLSQGLSYLSFTNLFASAIALALAEPIVRLLFERKQFGPDATHRVGFALACLAPGLVLFSANNILARAFYALSDIKTPVKISMVSLVLNLVFSIWLVHPYREAGLAVANTLSACFNCALLTYALRRRLGRLGLTSLVSALVSLVPAALFAGVAAAGTAWLWEKYLGHATLLLKTGEVFVPGAIGGLCYLLPSLWLRVPAAVEVTTLVLGRFKRAGG